ncbi:6670_t:CDS:2 [Funneliformis mosseae]|uniref:6670_t:CDS:1 n=1 Tax=Funneliformis mosseae TaxID=27381 RepID=A0A9N9CP21_FUNMO|nr:6670_t:CDS:2 [Funneliformis mosseae]
MGDLLGRQMFKDTRPDRQVARKWEDERKSDRTIGGSSIYLHNSTFAGNAIVNNSGTINDNKLTESKRDQKDEIDNFFQSSEGKSTNLFKKRQKQDISYETDEEADESDSEDSESEYLSSDTDVTKHAPLLLPSKLECFVDSYNAMSQSKKWILSSGICVEDVLFNKGKQLSVESSIHSWIIDLSYWEIKQLFTDDDWCEITEEVRELYERVAKTLSRFRNIRTTADLRKVLETTSCRNKNELFDREIHFDVEWIDHVMRRFLMYYEDPDESLKLFHLEGWYDANVWSLIIDCAFSNIRGLQTVRKDSSSIAVSRRKNRKRTQKERAKLGRRLDGILRTYNDNVEYGAIEVKSSFVQINSTERLKDRLKLSKSMHDMLVCLTHLVKSNEDKIRQLQVVGLQHSGLKLQINRMSSTKGYISVLKGEDLNEIPTQIKNIKNLFMVLISVWRAKKMVMECIEVIDEKLPDLTEEEFIQEIINGGKMINRSVTTSPPLVSISLPWSFDT